MPDEIFHMIMEQYEGVDLDRPASCGGVPTRYVKKSPVSRGGKRKTKKNKRKSRRQKTL